jgi:hypothetical protein
MVSPAVPRRVEDAAVKAVEHTPHITVAGQRARRGSVWCPCCRAWRTLFVRAPACLLPAALPLHAFLFIVFFSICGYTVCRCINVSWRGGITAYADVAT